MGRINPSLSVPEFDTNQKEPKFAFSQNTNESGRFLTEAGSHQFPLFKCLIFNKNKQFSVYVPTFRFFFSTVLITIGMGVNIDC